METENMMESRIVASDMKPEERKYETRLRPVSFKEYVGQNSVVDNIKIMIESANRRESAMDHALLSGPPGLGKTSLAMLMAKSLNSELHVVSGPALEKKGDLAAILTNLQPRDVLFIDEIHRLHITIEEILYSAMEDFRLDIVMGQGVAARTMQIDLPEFTLIGATTRSGLLSHPLRDRFMADLHFDFYSPDDLVKIVSNNFKKMKLQMSAEAASEISFRSRGTPRIANRILRRVRDFSIAKNHSIINIETVSSALAMMRIDDLGLDSVDRKIMTVINDYYSGGPVGIDALCATLGEDRSTIEDVYEPYLLKCGMLLRTPRGRTISDTAKNHLLKVSDPWY
jgi:Holliday junction DNA helicase RuvB